MRVRLFLCGIAIFLVTAEFGSAQQGNTTVQLPTFGIAIDADGVLAIKAFTDPGGRLQAARIAAARTHLPGELQQVSPLRKVSLVRLEKHVQQQLAAGQPLDQTAVHLAGLQRLQHVFLYPGRGDIVIAGPAEGWTQDGSGRAVGISSGRAVLLLQDLIVALRAYSPDSVNHPFIGCTISPDAEGLARLQEFQKTIPRFIPQQARQTIAAQIAAGSRQALGNANVQVFGIPADTHFASVMVEADYRMKLIGVGIEPPPVRMATFLDALTVPQHATLQRWWFTPNYEGVRVTTDRLGMELVGEGVQLQGEDKLIGEDGTLAATGAKSSRASELFTTAFTRKYSEIAVSSPVYGQLRNLIDMLIASAWLRQQDGYGQTHWTMDAFGDESKLAVQTEPTPRLVPCVVNSVWKGSRLISPAGGGVSIRPDLALAEDVRLSDENGRVAETRQKAEPTEATVSWWWD